MTDFNWTTDISPNALATMEEIGQFSPTSNVINKEVKGYIDGKHYWSANDLREMSAHFTEVADWLERRANEVTA